MAKKEYNNYDVIRDQPNADSFRYRDIRGEQDLKRDKRERPPTFTSYLVGAIVLTVLIALLTYTVVSVARWGFTAIGSVNVTEQSYHWIYDAELDQQVCIWDSDGQVHSGPPPVMTSARGGMSIGRAFAPGLANVLITLFVAGIAFSLMYIKFKKLYEAQIAEKDVKNDHVEDVWLQTVDEMLDKYDYFPDKAGHMSIQPSSIIAHIGVTNKGIKKVPIPRRLTDNVMSEDGTTVERYKGDFDLDDDDEKQYDQLPLFDEAFREELFSASGVPNEKALRRSFDLTHIKYNPGGKNRDKLGKYDTVADLINADCEIPDYEVGRPGGLYIVDTAPVNTMVLAITRAGKGNFDPGCPVTSSSCALIALKA